ncbi:MAG: hypothetical protein OEY86_02365 [Nitrospira sp.]|nr:hypothetical protein [Nitrospira sp.]
MRPSLFDTLAKRGPVRPIQRPFPGESVLGISPPLDRTVDPLWSRRANLYPGRSLSDTILTVEQTERIGHLAASGSMMSSGTVQGLDVVLEQTESGGVLVLSPGYGVASNGEDVVISTPQRIPVTDIPVITSARVSGDAPAARPFGELLASGEPVVGVLVLQPAVVEIVADTDPADPCEQDPRNFAFEDWQRVDGCRLCCVLWDESWLPRPVFDSQWRNRLAYVLFQWEQHHPESETPWSAVGLPISLIGGQGGEVSFLDSAAVVRTGGKRLQRQGLISHVGTPFVWQARVQQFAEHVAEMQESSLTIEAIAGACRFLPPVGLLPKDALTVGAVVGGVRTWTNRFFPSTFNVDLMPIPIEQVDVMVTACASLSPLDMTRAEQVRVLVPVPQSSFEPELLRVAHVEPIFQETIDRFVEARGKWLRRRADLRDIVDALNRAILGTPVTYATPDPEALETEAIADDPLLGSEGPLSVPEENYGTTVGEDDMETPVVKATAFEELRAALDTSTPLSDAEVEELPKRGLAPFIEFLEDKVRRANDMVDFGFLQAQTNIYRFRQLMLSNDAASRLVTSPALASIAQGESASATRKDLAEFLTKSEHKIDLESIAKRPIDTKAGGSHSPSVPTGLGVRAFRADVGMKTPLSGAGSGIELGPNVVGRTSGVTIPFEPTTTEILKKETAGTLAKPSDTKKVIESKDVEKQSPILGKPLDFRTVTVAERLKEPPAPEAKNFGVASKFDIVSSIVSLDLHVDDLPIPGFLGAPINEKRSYETKTVKAIRDGGLSDKILLGEHDPDPEDGDEGAYFSAGIRAVDFSVAALRLVEGRIAGYRQAIERCRSTLIDLQTAVSMADQRLSVVGQELAEARHDVGVSRALLAEETFRMQGINERRERILSEQVKFYAFVRPRQVTAVTDVPVRSLDPGLAESPVPACLAGHDDIPEELRAIVALFRHAPVKWFPRFPKLLEKLNRVEVLHRTLLTAKTTMQARTATEAGDDLPVVISSRVVDRLGQSISGVYEAQRAVVRERRLELARFDVSVLSNASWTQALSHAQEILSLSDVLEGRHGQAELTKQASRELADMANVAACLYVQFGDVPPVLRLEWAEQLSQFDTPVNLRNLSSLPRWAEVDSFARRSMQTLVDWLYGRVDARNAQAVDLMHDLVRICLLLASHAPVNQIIAGHVEKPTTVKPGSRVPLVITPGAVRVGMQVSLYAGAQVVAQGLVEDVGEHQAVAHVMQTAQPTVSLSAKAVAHFGQVATTFIRGR